MLSEEVVSDLPPSAKLIMKVLEYDSDLTQKEISEESRLPQRTVRDGVKRLRDAGVVEKDVYILDARQDLYRLTEEETSTTVEAE